jgi:hypothetical protein
VQGDRLVILVTDGEETCGGDPAREIEALTLASPPPSSSGRAQGHGAYFDAAGLLRAPQPAHPFDHFLHTEAALFTASRTSAYGLGMPTPLLIARLATECQGSSRGRRCTR